ncbi:1-aminocyclopropane-1-carboxylate deaminase/D-cysteine desulfhydrase [Rhodohalobacter barkolensis]|uniref:Tryptophan synthase beta chain-like PALP domain-containing protein n=1 Tax=Rhodohalobacter barkolensis TaxID=2053187 RepID=A0A2N0VKG1_9BACT|nr:pyridoxal-phosphate dependent enzyme [Rhodohalobacter barkolensis]PKD44654.1 hypothetical protein CWD77_04105 [Rhodohalobacter barkolensis]
MKTILKKYNSVSDWLDVDLKVKHDDLYPFIGGGSKARKIQFILKDAENKGSNALVSAGAANSNHARVVALAGAQKGWPVKLIIHDSEDYSNGNLLLMKMAGADLNFVNHADVSDAMDEAMNDFKENGFLPYYIWGGGHNVYGMQAYYEAVLEVKKQLSYWVPDYVIHASGTGGTQSGLHVGFEECFPNTKVIGISVAREKGRGTKVVEEGVHDLRKLLGIESQKKDVIFLDNWIKDGYSSVYPKLVEVIKEAAKFGFITDPVYTGKALLALYEMRNEEQIESGAKVLFWHTGGLINLLKEHQRFL